MLIPGLVSVTFRQLAPRELTELAASSGLRSIEWGGDIHVPPDNPANAREVAALTAAAGLQTAAYGSYYRCVTADGDLPEFEPILETAVALDAPKIRVWAGSVGSEDVDDRGLQVLADRLRVAAEMAGKSGVGIALEFHGGTYTDTTASTLRLLDAVDHPNLDTLWQTPRGMAAPECLSSLEACLQRASNLHVFHWALDGERLALADGLDDWREYLALLNKDGKDRHLLLEFVTDNAPALLPREAATLRRLIDRS